MIYSLMMQFKLVGFSMAAGILTGFIFDFYRIFRGFENVHKIFIIIEDILFWVFASIVIFVFLLYTNQAVISSYVYLWMAIGIFIYLKLISKSFVKIQYNIILTISKIFRIIKNMVLYPFKLLVYGGEPKNK